MIGPTVSNISVEDRRVTWRCRDPYERAINPAIGRRSLTTPPFSGHRKGWFGWPLLNLRPINQANSYKFVTHENVRGITSLPLSLSLFLARLFLLSSSSHPFLILLHFLLVFLFFFFHSLIRFLFKKEKEKGRKRRPLPPAAACVFLSSSNAQRRSAFSPICGIGLRQPPSRRVYDRFPRAFLSVA